MFPETCDKVAVVFVPSHLTDPSQIAWEVRKDLVMKMESVMATGHVAETVGAPAITATKGSSVWIASTASSAATGTTPSLCAQVCLNTDAASFHLAPVGTAH